MDAVEKWRPSTQKTEKEYEDALYAYLHSRFPNSVFHQQYSLARTRADIFVDFGQDTMGGTKVAIEVKAHLASRDDFHRLFGQMFEYTAVWEADALLVLCGDCEPAMVKLARRFVDMLNGSYFVRKARTVVVP